jgi:hypothetical protein
VSSFFKKKLRLGYSFWGYLSDYKYDELGKEVSTPDGNATYSWSIVHEAQQRGWSVYGMQQDRDWRAVAKHGKEAFASFSKEKRFRAWSDTYQTMGSQFPELDVLLVEWRFPIIGRNCVDATSWAGEGAWGFPVQVVGGKEVMLPGYQPDLMRQVEILEHYSTTDTKIILWDLDHKLTRRDEENWEPDAIFETSQHPRHLSMERTRVEPPIVVSELLQHPTLPVDPEQALAYVGSRYERDEVIDKYVGPVGQKMPGRVHFWGKWEPRDELRKRWPGVVFHDRIPARDFRSAYARAGGVPLLAKPSYLQSGFITPRPWEALLFGSVPVGLLEAQGSTQYASLVVDDGESMVQAAEALAGLELSERDQMRRNVAKRLEFMDVKHFVDKLVP